MAIPLGMVIALLLTLPIYLNNIALFRWINGYAHDLLDLPMGILSGFGDGLVIALVVGIVMFYRLRAGTAALLAFIASGIIAQAIKRSFDMPRPPALLDHVHVLGHALQSHSFPSGHATSCGVMLVLAFLLWSPKNWRAWLFAAPFALAAIGRVYGGVHFPLDVWVGLLIGVATMLLCWRLSASWPCEQWLASPWLPRILGSIVLIEAAVLGLGYHIQPATAHPLLLALPVTALVILWHYWKQHIAAVPRGNE
jgi:membrane-associated phospholipid phosphatase